MCLLAVGFCALGLRADAPQLPATPKKPVEDVYHGVKVVDPYRWLEDADDPAVRKWVDAQNRFSRAYLDKLPGRKALYERLKKLNDTDDMPYDHLTYQDGKLFAQSGELLVTLKSADDPDSERGVVDPVAVTKKDTATIDFYQVSPDGKKVAVSISAEGREIVALHLFDAATGKALPDVVPNVKSPLGGSMVWKGDGSGFY
jgi:prolyl oligopeptidase